LETKDKMFSWTADGVFRCSGIRTKLHALYRLPHNSNCCNQPEEYGFRYGSLKEVKSLTMQPTDMGILNHQHQNNLFTLLARRDEKPKYSKDNRSNLLELKISKLEQIHKYQQERFSEAEQLLLKQNETIRLLKEQLEFSQPEEERKSRKLEKRVKVLLQTMKGFEDSLEQKREREGKLAADGSRTCSVM